MIQYKYLNFYDKGGDNLNLAYDSTLGLWTGRVHIPSVSTDLIESYQIFVSEEFKTGPTADSVFGKPHIFGGTGATSTITAYWADDKIPEMFLYSFDSSVEKVLLEKSLVQSIELDIDATETIAATGSTGIKYTSNVTNEVISVNVGFCPKDDIAYESVLHLKDNETDVDIAQITFYGEGILEDERLGVLLDNLGWNINNQDFKIFQSTNIKEDLADHEKLNQKRKELLLEFENIFQYLGSYKALINIVKYFGYDNVKIKEYWKNVDIDSVNFGKFRQTDIVDIFSEGGGDPNVSERLIPNKFYKKTSNFGLFYSITEWDGGYDEDGIPTVVETNQFSIEEVLIKLFALKNKLKSHFLPLNARIIDIVGEALYFTKYDINVWTDMNRIDVVDLNIVPKVEVEPSQFGYISDLRALQHLGCPIAPDLTVGGTHSYQIFNFTNNEADEGDKFVIRDTITNNSIEYTTQYLEGDAETLLGLVDAWNASTAYPFINFQVYPFGATANGVMRVVEQEDTTFDFAFDITQGPVSGTPTIISTELFMGASAISEYAECFLGYFVGNQVAVEDLNDQPEIPVGFATVLNNRSFEIPWDDMCLTWDSVDEKETGIGASNYGYPLYGPYINSFASIAATGPSGSTYSTVDPEQFPFTIYNTTGYAQYQWDNIEKMNFYEMRWLITCTESGTTGATAWTHDTGYQAIELIKKYPLILPYVGKYKLELFMNDLYNGKSYLKTEDYFEVEARNPNIIGWYEDLNEKYNWDSKKEDRVTLDKTPDSLEVLTWENYNASWNLPVHPNEELNMGEMSFDALDKIEFYQRQFNENPTDPKISHEPYFWNNLGKNNWEDFEGLYWDECNPTLVKFNINSIGITGPSISIANTITGRLSVFEFTDLGGTGITGMKEAVNQLNNYTATDITNTNTLARADVNTEDLFDRFMFYYDEKYENAFGATHPHAAIPYITAVSKSLESPRSLDIGYTGMSGDDYAFNYTNFGSIGDIPTGFEIYTFGVGATIQIDSNEIFTVGATVSTLEELADDLNASTLTGISDYEYNIVQFYAGGTHTGTGATGMTFDHNVKIIAVNKTFVSEDPAIIKYGPRIIGTTYARSLTTNMTWDMLRVLKYSNEIRNLTKVAFSYDNSDFAGGKNPIWKIHKENDINWNDIYYTNELMTYLFTEKGSYTVSIELEDTNGNRNSIIKRELIKII